MRITVSSIPRDGLDLSLEEELEPEDLRLAGPVSVRVKLRRVGDRVVLEGRVAALAELQCGNCLDTFRKESGSDFFVEYSPVPPEGREGEHELSAAELDVGFYQGDEIDLDGLIKEQLFLAVPMRPICRDSCRGLCPVCGGNRNRQDCSCSSEKLDPRFSVLMKLKGESDGEPDQ